MAKGLMYTASSPAGGFAQAAARELIQIGGNANCIAVIHSVRIGQFTEFADAAAEALSLEWYRCTTLGAGTAAVEEPLQPAGAKDLSADCVVVVNAAVSTGLTILGADSINVQAGYLYLPTPDEQIVVPAVATEGVCWQVSVPNDSITWTVTMVWEEFNIT